MPLIEDGVRGRVGRRARRDQLDVARRHGTGGFWSGGTRTSGMALPPPGHYSPSYVDFFQLQKSWRKSRRLATDILLGHDLRAAFPGGDTLAAPDRRARVRRKDPDEFTAGPAHRGAAPRGRAGPLTPPVPGFPWRGRDPVPTAPTRAREPRRKGRNAAAGAWLSRGHCRRIICRE
jgi:hypothetical protein